MDKRDYKAFIVEGEVREPLIINNISKVFFANGNIKIITLPAGQNIYMLWKKIKEDDFETDIIEVLREEHKEIEMQLLGLSRNDFSEIYLFFDYDGHQNNLGMTEGEEVLEQMLQCFDNETEMGKLYISYPMVEALREFEPGECGDKDRCYVLLHDMENYKHRSSEHVKYPQFKNYDFEIWKSVIEVFVMRLSCLMKNEAILTYEKYTELIDPYEIFKMEERHIEEKKIFVLSAFPEFVLDYFGIKIWKKCIKHNKLNNRC